MISTLSALRSARRAGGQMAWPQNHGRLATATMFTLFFAGRDFAPRLTIGSENAQDFLQGHYLRAFARVARVLRGLRNVVGFDTLNEPHYGLVGWPDVRRTSRYRHGLAHSWYQAMLAGEGFPQQARAALPEDALHSAVRSSGRLGGGG